VTKTNYRDRIKINPQAQRLVKALDDAGIPSTRHAFTPEMLKNWDKISKETNEWFKAVEKSKRESDEWLKNHPMIFGYKG